MDQLNELAGLYEIQTQYHDISGQVIEANPEALVEILRVFGVEIDSSSDMNAALITARRRHWKHVIEPVTVAWQGRESWAELRIPSGAWEEPIEWRILFEDGRSQSGIVKVSELPWRRNAEFDSERYEVRGFRLPDLPAGYHQLRVEFRGDELRCLILAAPWRCCEPPKRHMWGGFAPLYALHSKESSGSGNVSDLKALEHSMSELGADFVATLPLMASFLGDHPFEPSPYAPTSRLFWNEMFIDMRAIPELSTSPEAQRIMASSEFQDEISRLRAERHVDYHSQMRLMRRVLEQLVREFFASGSEKRRNDFNEFLHRHSEVGDYAVFRATTEKQGKPWHQWPESWKRGTVPVEAYDEAARLYHVYVQWLVEEQFRDFSEQAKADGGGLYLDFPLGVHPDGYDIWREGPLFARTMSVGAPPDPFAAQGQDWGFSPLHPSLLRQEHYRYFIDVIRHQLAHATILRLDHVMSLYRLFWIPNGMGASNGVYVRYRDDELWAILCIESQRHQAMIVGEDLGTVPDAVRNAMDEHGIRRMYVLQYQLEPDREHVLNHVPDHVVASMNTHDAPTYTSFLNGFDIDSQAGLGTLSKEEAQNAHDHRKWVRRRLFEYLQWQGYPVSSVDDEQGLLDAALAFLAKSDAEMVIVNLEDLWHEPDPQNTPGTTSERPNWKRKLQKDLETMFSSDAIVEQLRTIDALRKERG
jgi:4-alpha-glucanotransferase